MNPLPEEREPRVERVPDDAAAGPGFARRRETTADPARPSDDAGASDDAGDREAIAVLATAAAAMRASAASGERTRRIPLERLEVELARVLRIELAYLLLRAHEILVPRPCARVCRAQVRALRRDAAETLAVARASGVRVPRVVRRIAAGGPDTWPAPARIARWAAALHPGIAPDAEPGVDAGSDAACHAGLHASLDLRCADRGDASAPGAAAPR